MIEHETCTTSWLTQSVGSVTLSITPNLTILLSSSFSLSFRANGTRLAEWMTGWTSSLIVMWCIFGNVPISPKQSLNSLNKSSAFVCSLNSSTLAIKFKSLHDFNPRIAEDLVSATIKGISDVVSWCSILNLHCPLTDIEDPFYAVNFVVEIWRVGRFLSWLNMRNGRTLTSAPVSNLYVIAVSFESSLTSHSFVVEDSSGWEIASITKFSVSDNSL